MSGEPRLRGRTLTRRHAITAAALLLGAACGSHHDGATAASAPPSASQVVTVPAAPVDQGSVTNDQSAFLVRIESVRTAATFTDGSRSVRAGRGEQLVVVRIHITNTGKRPSQLEIGNSDPVTLVAATGKSYSTDISWSSGKTIAPGQSRVEPYVFHIPARTKVATVMVGLVDSSGTPSTVSLTVP